jgi:hypothetical protein
MERDFLSGCCIFSEKRLNIVLNIVLYLNSAAPPTTSPSSLAAAAGAAVDGHRRRAALAWPHEANAAVVVVAVGHLQQPTANCIAAAAAADGQMPSPGFGQRQKTKFS